MRPMIKGAARAAASLFCLAALAACATSPAPIGRVAAARPPVSAVLPPIPFETGEAPRRVAGFDPLQCVPYARDASGIQIYGNANTWWSQAEGRYPRSSSPAPGSVFVMRGYRTTARGHVAVVTQVVSPRIIRVDQANWLNQGEVTVNVPVMDVSPNNDWSEVRVWYIPTQAWGARVYQAEGFIHPFTLMASAS